MGRRVEVEEGEGDRKSGWRCREDERADDAVVVTVVVAVVAAAIVVEIAVVLVA